MIAPASAEMVKDYLHRGWRLVLLESKSKKPVQTGWQTGGATEADALSHLALGGNLGVLVGEPSGNLVDVDLDCPEAVKLAPVFLPATSRTHGRPSNPSSHWWYVSQGVQTTRYEDERGIFLELRGTGTQTALPPSVHPEGESFVWSAEGEPATVDGPALKAAVTKLAVATLLARHWPGNGHRHELTMALSTVLLNSGWLVVDTSKVITQAAKVGGDEEWRERARDVETTDKRLANGEPVTGPRKAGEILGQPVLSKLYQWLGVDADGGEKSTAAILRPLTALGEKPSLSAVESALRRVGLSLNGADPLKRVTIRQAAIDTLESKAVTAPAKLVDAALCSVDYDGPDVGQGRPIEFPAIVWWPDPVEGGAVLDEIAATFKRFVALPEQADTALALWTVHTHAEAAASISPILCLSSPVKRCGKTTTLWVLGQLAPKPLKASNITGPTIFRTVEMYAPTLLIDEADTYITDDESMRGILNSGHIRSGAQVIRLVGEDYEPRAFRTWCPKAIALIKHLPATLEDRSIVVRLRRRLKHEHIERQRMDQPTKLEPIRQRIARWVGDNLEALKAADPEVPDALHDRAADNWRPLLAIADQAGGEWPQRAREAALALSGEAEETGLEVRLLADIQQVWPGDEDFLPTSSLIARLNVLVDSPWSQYRKGKGVSAEWLGRKLKGVLRAREGDTRGYRRADMDEAWARFAAK